MSERRDGESIMIVRLPEAKPYDETLLERFDQVKEVISALRNIRKEHNLPNKDTLELCVLADSNFHPEFNPILMKMGNLSAIRTVDAKCSDAATFMVKTTEYFVPLNDKIDTEEELKKLKADLTYMEGFLASVLKKLSNERFVQNAPAKVVETERAKQNDAEAKIKALQERIAQLSK